jgi:endoglucanase
MNFVALQATVRARGAAWRKAMDLSGVAACALLASCGSGDGEAGGASSAQVAVSGSAASSQSAAISVTSQDSSVPIPVPTPTPTPSPAVNNPSKAPPGSITPYQAQVGACINLGNHLDAPNEGDWGRKLVASDFTDIAKVGFQTIRLPVRWSSHADLSPPYTVDPAFFKRIDEVLNQAIYSARLRVILDFHHYDELMADPTGQQARFVAIWRQIATRYRSMGNKLWFELLNEPNNKLTNDNISSVLDPALAAIRETNATRPVLYTGAVGSTVWSLYSVKTPADPNLILTVHDYTPSDYTHQGMTNLGYAATTGLTFGSATDIWTLNDHANVVKTYMASTGRAVILGEYGVNENAPVEERAKYYSLVSKAYNQVRVNSCAWSYTAGGFAFRDKASNEWAIPLLRAIGL